MPNRNLMVTSLDVARLERLMDRFNVLPGITPPTDRVSQLGDRLLDAMVVPGQSIPPDVVTMNSRVQLTELGAGDESEVTLVYPKDVDHRPDTVSVLSPLGQVLLGASTGEVLEVLLPGGGRKYFAIGTVTYQPEAAGDFFS